ncbi:MAG: glycosyltransferase family 39 protein [Thermogemmatispora sp.]|uniref:ArnT family glycosyltransferase n=1 Tax=Thermogemmatispora sp. TaxID=1968838 RepID=UPI00260BA294|nr:glycosyltransferase family 39 protein [Thermogemmatispora sp.]MBX5458554.1 glycosyltransferase family 39 protein [Thermogemmatispora sp.]
MTNEVIVDRLAPVSTTPGPQSARSRWLSRAGLCLLLAIGLGMRLYQLGQPLERDFDEGVYLQSLRAMSHGFALYSQIFYSQPPFFLESIFPIYVLAGQTLWAGRLAIALLSLCGLIGAWLLGKALHGYTGAFIALLLTLTSVSFLNESRVLQADGPSVALSLLAVGLAFYWWQKPAGWRGLLLVILSGIALALSISTKFLVVPALLPAASLVLARYWQLRRSPQGEATPLQHLALWGPVAGILAFLLVTLLLFLPFIGSFHVTFQSIVSFHTQSSESFRYTLRTLTLPLLAQGLLTPLTLAGLAGTIVAALRRDWRVVPLLLWLGGTLAVLLEQRPLFVHHLIALVPPLVGLSALGSPDLAALSRRFQAGSSERQRNLRLASSIMVIVLAISCTFALGQDILYFRQPPHSVTPAGPLQRVVTDLEHLTKPGDMVISDEPLAVALAGRDTPPWLVDTSSVRIHTGYLTLQDLITASQAPQVRAVLFFSSRFHLPEVESYHSWVAQHFHLVRTYGKDSTGHPQELWVR